MLSKKMEEALNEQLNAELQSAYLYLSMSTYFESINLPGFAHWMRVQDKEEIGHVMKFYNYIVERRARVTLGAVDAPQSQWASPLAAFEDALKHEQKVTALIYKLAALAQKESDPATGVFLQWFINEQVEEEAAADKIVQMLRMIAQAPGGLFILDRELAKRSSS